MEVQTSIHDHALDNLPEIFTHEEIDKILYALKHPNKQRKGDIGKWLSLRNCAILLLSYHLALRTNETLSIRKDDIDFKAKLVRIRPEGNKLKLGRTLPIPKEAWSIYQELKRDSRTKAKEVDLIENETYAEKREREKQLKEDNIRDLRNQGKSYYEIGAMLGLSGETVRRHLRTIEVKEKMQNPTTQPSQDTNIIYNLDKKDNLEEIPERFNKIVEK